MGKKLTQEEIEKTTQDLNSNLIIIEPYDYKNRKIKLKCNICKKEQVRNLANFYKSGTCIYCEREKSHEKSRKTNEQFKKDFERLGNPNVELVERYVKLTQKIKVRCKNNPNHVWESLPSNLLKGRGCPFCANKKISGENSVGVVHPDLIKYFKNKKDSYNYTPYSSKKVELVCPNCGREKRIKIPVSHLTERGFLCDYCSDNISRPNKFLRNLLWELKENELIKDFKLEYNPGWEKKYLFDAFVVTKEEEFFVEMQGSQHYTDRENLFSKGAKERDWEKFQSAQRNNAVVIYIDCFSTEFQYMKENILNSELSQKINFEKVNWDKIEKSMANSFLKEICEFYQNNPLLNIEEISKIKKIDRNTLRGILKRGSVLGFCDYNTKEIRKINQKFKILKPIIVTYSDGRIEKFASVTETRIGLGFNFNTTIYDILKKGGSYKDYNIRYATEEEAKEIKEKWIIEQKSKIKNS